MYTPYSNAAAVPKDVSDADRRRVAELEKLEAYLRLEVSKLKVHTWRSLPIQFTTVPNYAYAGLMLVDTVDILMDALGHIGTRLSLRTHT